MRCLGQIGKVLGGNGGVKKGLAVLVAVAVAIGSALGYGVKTASDKQKNV